MHASVMERRAPDGVCGMTQQRSGGRWRALDGGLGAENDGSVIPRQAPRHEAAPNAADHEDTLVRMLYDEHAGPLLMFVLRLTGGDRQRAEDIVQETLLRAWRNAHRLGAQVLATASGARLDAARALGADRVIDSEAEDFTGIEPVDLVFDTVGGQRLERSPGVIVRGGRLVSISQEPPAAACAEHGVDGVYFVVEPDAAQLRELSTLVGSGDLRLPEVTTFPLQQGRPAFEQSLTGSRKVVLEVSAS